MAFYGTKPVITENGLNLLSRAFAGEINIEFTHIEFGSGFYMEDEKTEEALQKVTSLKEKKQACFFSSKSAVSPNKILLKALLSNETLTEGYYINEVAIFAKARGEDDTSAVLYSISVAHIGDYMPKYNGTSPIQIIQQYYTAVNNATNITLSINNHAVALAEDLDYHVRDEERHITSDERLNWNDTYNALLYLVDVDNILTSFNGTFTLISQADPTALSTEEIEEAIATEWNGESSADPTALSAEEIEEAIATEWNGETSEDPTALSAEEIREVIS